MKALGIEVGVGVNAAGFKEGLQQVQTQLEGFGKGWMTKAFGGGAVAALGAFVVKQFKSAVDDIKEINIGKIKMGVDAQTFMRVRNALEASGTSAEAFDRALVNLSETMEKAKEAGPEGQKAAQALAELGVSLTDVNNKGRQRIFQQISTDLRDAANNAELTEAKLAALKHVFGKNAVELLPFMARGDNAADLAGVHDDATMKALEEAKKSSNQLKGIWRDIKEQAVIWGASVSKGVGEMLDYFNGNYHPDQAAADKQNEEHFKQIEAKLKAAKEEKAKKEADTKASEDEKQKDRETIAQLEAERDAFLEKSKPKGQRLKDIKDQMESLRQDRLNDAGPNADVKRATIDRRLAELGLEKQELEKASIPSNKIHVNDLQRIGAAINTPIDLTPARETARNTARISQQIDRWSEKANRFAPRSGSIFDEPGAMA